MRTERTPKINLKFPLNRQMIKSASHMSLKSPSSMKHKKAKDEIIRTGRNISFKPTLTTNKSKRFKKRSPEIKLMTINLDSESPSKSNVFTSRSRKLFNFSKQEIHTETGIPHHTIGVFGQNSQKEELIKKEEGLFAQSKSISESTSQQNHFIQEQIENMSKTLQRR